MTLKTKTEKWHARDRICGRGFAVVELTPATGAVAGPAFCPFCGQIPQYELVKPVRMSADIPAADTGRQLPPDEPAGDPPEPPADAGAPSPVRRVINRILPQ